MMRRLIPIVVLALLGTSAASAGEQRFDSFVRDAQKVTDFDLTEAVEVKERQRKSLPLRQSAPRRSRARSH